MPIPNESTPIKHKVLTDIFAKGLLIYDEMRICLFIIRWSWGFHKNWTEKEFNISEIAGEINMNRGVCSREINKMMRENKLLRKDNKWQFNEHYKTWGVANSDSVAKSDSEVLQKATVGVANSDSQQSTNSDEKKAEEAPKEISSKDIKNKDISIVSKDTETKLKVKDETQIKATELIKEFCLLRGIPLDSGFFAKNIRAARSLVNHYEIEVILAGVVWRLQNDENNFWVNKLWTLNSVYSYLAQWIAEASQKPHPKTFTNWLEQNPALDYRKLSVETMKEKNEYAKVKAFFLAFNRALKDGVTPTKEEWNKYQSARNLSKEQGGK